MRSLWRPESPQKENTKRWELKNKARISRSRPSSTFLRNASDNLSLWDDEGRNPSFAHRPLEKSFPLCSRYRTNFIASEDELSISSESAKPPSPHRSIYTWFPFGGERTVSGASRVLRSGASGSVGAGGEGFVQLDVQGRRESLQTAETGLAHSTGLKQLLAWHRDLLIATAGTEHIPTIPAEVRRRGGGSQRKSSERKKKE